VVPKPEHFGLGTTPRTTFGRAALLTQKGNLLPSFLFLASHAPLPASGNADSFAVCGDLAG
jgi:hypothetical protein